jgi:hypothetical protein
MRTALGDGYAEALRGAWPDVPESADFVMFWWNHAAELVRAGALKQFGFITTNSIRQSFNRRVLERHLTGTVGCDERSESHRSGKARKAASDAVRPMKPGSAHPTMSALSISFAIPDHPWVDTADGAAVRIAMTVASSGSKTGRLLQVLSEDDGPAQDEVDVVLSERSGIIHADLTVGANLGAALPMRANLGLSFMGMIPLGEGFWISPEEAQRLSVGVDAELKPHLREYRNGKDILYTPRGILALDFFGMEENELRTKFPAAYQWLLERVKPTRANDKRKSYRDNWWFFAEARPALRRALMGLRRYIGTTETAKHRVFMFLGEAILPDQKIRVIALEDALALAVLSSQVHVTWAMATGATLEDRPVYNNSRCFDPFPFPAAADEQQTRIRNLAEQLDAHRKRQQAAHPDLTLTGMYNVLDKLRGGEPLTVKERAIHEQGLVSVLRQLHDELDAAVLDAYGWSDLLPLLRVAHGNDAPSPPAPLPQAGEGRQEEAKRAFDEAILERLVALNAERAAEEARGLVRWLRPGFQNPLAQTTPQQHELDTEDDEPGEDKPKIAAKLAPWPKDAVEQVRAVADTLVTSTAPLSIDDIAARFTARGAWKKRLPQLLEMLVALGRAREQDGRYFDNRL